MNLTKMKAKKVFIEFVACLLLTIITFSLILGIETTRNKIFHLYGDIYYSILLWFVLPILEIIGVTFVNKIIYKIKEWNIVGVIFLVLFNFLGLIIFGLFVEIFIRTNMPDETYYKIDEYIWFFIFPLIMIISSVIGYNLGEPVSNKVEKLLEKNTIN